MVFKLKLTGVAEAIARRLLRKPDPDKYGIPLEKWRAQRHSSHATTKTAPPSYTLWIENERDGAEVFATAQSLTTAITQATYAADQLAELVLVLETNTGRGWAVQALR